MAPLRHIVSNNCRFFMLCSSLDWVFADDTHLTAVTPTGSSYACKLLVRRVGFLRLDVDRLRLRQRSTLRVKSNAPGLDKFVHDTNQSWTLDGLKKPPTILPPMHDHVLTQSVHGEEGIFTDRSVVSVFLSERGKVKGLIKSMRCA